MFGLSFLSLKIIVFGIIIALVAGYIGFLHLEVNHYKQKASDYESEYTTLVKNQATRIAELEATTAAQDQQRKADADTAAKAIQDLKQSNLTEIKKHEEELRSCKLSDTAVSVFNSPNGTSDRPQQKDTSGKANAPDVSGPSGVEKPTIQVGEQLTLADLLIVNEENKANFEQMRETIKARQKLWQETERNLNASTGPN